MVNVEMRVLVTGSTGFIGKAVLAYSESGAIRFRGTVRRHVSNMTGKIESVSVGDLGPDTDWRCALDGIDAVVHTAGRVHVMRDSAADPLAEFRHVNVAGTLNLARQAAAAGVRRLIFISSIKVNGEATSLGRPYTSDDEPAPLDPYGVSKHEAEEGLRRVAQNTGLEVVIIRPVLVYGPGVKANFLSMMRWLYHGIPLPLGAINNRRSLVALDNLVDLIITCLYHPVAANQIFLVSDGEDLSTPELLRRTAAAMGRHVRLMRVSEPLLESIASFFGKTDFVRRLCGSLQVDISKTKEMLGWKPPVSVDEALQKTVRYFLPQINAKDYKSLP